MPRELIFGTIANGYAEIDPVSTARQAQLLTPACAHLCTIPAVAPERRCLSPDAPVADGAPPGSGALTCDGRLAASNPGLLSTACCSSKSASFLTGAPPPAHTHPPALPEAGPTPSPTTHRADATRHANLPSRPPDATSGGPFQSTSQSDSWGGPSATAFPSPTRLSCASRLPGAGTQKALMGTRTNGWRHG